MIKYAPYIDGTIGAFDLKHGLKVPFTHSKAVGMWDKPMTLLIKELNSEVIGMIQSEEINPNDSESVAFFNYYDPQVGPQKEDEYYILSKQEGNTVKLLPGQYYKIQLAYGAIPEDVSDLTFSSVGVTKFLGYDVKIENERLDNNTYRIKYSCLDDTYELPYSYNLKFYLDNELYYQHSGYFTPIEQTNKYIDVTHYNGLDKGDYKVYAEVTTTNKGLFTSPTLHLHNYYWLSKIPTDLLDVQLNNEYGEVKISLKETDSMEDYEVYRMENNDFSTLQNLQLALSHVTDLDNGGKALTNLIVGDSFKIIQSEEKVAPIKIFGKNLFPMSCSFNKNIYRPTTLAQRDGNYDFPFEYEQGQIKILPNRKIMAGRKYNLYIDEKIDFPTGQNYYLKLIGDNNFISKLNFDFLTTHNSVQNNLESYGEQYGSIIGFRITPTENLFTTSEIVLQPSMTLGMMDSLSNEMPMDPILLEKNIEHTITIPRKNLYIFTANTEANLQIKTNNNSYIIDNTLEHYKNYKYLAINSNNIIGEVHEIRSEFEDMFLQDEDHCLRIKFNPKVASFKYNTQEIKVDTIGGQFPSFYRNGILSYAEFPISGFLSYWMGDNGKFIYDYELGLQPEELPQTSAFEIDSEGSFEVDANAPGGVLEIKKVVNEFKRTTNLTHYNFAAERKYKMQVYNWLNNGKMKIFRSPAEGNFIVRLMNISLSPEEKLGRMLHTFNATAYEGAEYSFENFKKYKLAFKREEMEK